MTTDRVESIQTNHTLTLHVDQPKANELWVTCACGWKGTTFEVGGDEVTFDRQRGTAMYYAQGHIITSLISENTRALTLIDTLLERNRKLTEVAAYCNHTLPCIQQQQDGYVACICGLHDAIAALESSQ